MEHESMKIWLYFNQNLLVHSGRFCPPFKHLFRYRSVFIPEACHPQNDLKELKHGHERDAQVQRQGSANVADKGESSGPEMNLNFAIGHSTKFFFILWCLNNYFRCARLEVHMNLQEALLHVFPELINPLR